jgi:uncharacterized protein involved in exopolysaccharide biosynthesis
MRLDVGEMFDAVASRWRLLLVALAVTLAFAGLYIVATPARYAATMSFLLDNRERSNAGGDTPAPQGAESPFVENQMRLLTSKKVLQRVVEDLRLQGDPDFGGGGAGLASRLKSLILGKGAKPEPSVNQVSEVLARAITVKRTDKSYVIDVETRASNAEKAERVAQSLASAFLATQEQFSANVADAERKWLDGKIEDVRKRLQEAEARVQTYREARSLVTTDGMTPTDQQIKSADAALVEARGKRAEAEAIYAQVRAAAEAGSIETSKQAIRSPLLERLLNDQAALVNSLANMRANLGPRHPAMIARQAQLADLRAQIARELRNIAETRRRDVEAARKVEQVAQAHVADLSQAIIDGGGTRQELGDLERKVAVLRASYEKALAAREENHPEVIAWPNPVLISPPLAQETPVSPKPMAALIIAVAAAFNLWVAAALLLENASRRRTAGAPADPEPPAPSRPAPAPPSADRASKSFPWSRRGATEAPGSSIALPLFDVEAGETEADGDVAAVFARATRAMRSPETPYAQAVARVRKLIRAGGGVEGTPPIFAVTARAEKTGASTLSLCLALAASERGEQVLVIDCDARHPTLSALLPYLPPVVDQGGQGVRMFRGVHDEASGGRVLLGRLEPGDRLPIYVEPGIRLNMILLDCGARDELPDALRNALTGTLCLDRDGRGVRLVPPLAAAA